MDFSLFFTSIYLFVFLFIYFINFLKETYASFVSKLYRYLLLNLLGYLFKEIYIHIYVTFSYVLLTIEIACAKERKYIYIYRSETMHVLLL